jgi:hypothetical protein
MTIEGSLMPECASPTINGSSQPPPLLQVEERQTRRLVYLMAVQSLSETQRLRCVRSTPRSSHLTCTTSWAHRCCSGTTSEWGRCVRHASGLCETVTVARDDQISHSRKRKGPAGMRLRSCMLPAWLTVAPRTCTCPFRDSYLLLAACDPHISSHSSVTPPGSGRDGSPTSHSACVTPVLTGIWQRCVSLRLR